MIIERFFGKGRVAQPDAPSEPPTTQTQAPQKPRDSNGGASKPTLVPAAADSQGRRSEPAVTSKSQARSGGTAVATTSSLAGRPIAPCAEPCYEEIAARAYDLWAASGCVEGRDQENWIEAERQLRAERTRG
jgi:hypothetical protein